MGGCTVFTRVVIGEYMKFIRYVKLNDGEGDPAAVFSRK